MSDSAQKTAPARKYKKLKRRPHFTCQCGQPAVTVLTVHVGRQFDGYYTMRMPLCRSCLELEKAMWDEQLPGSDLHTPLIG